MKSVAIIGGGITGLTTAFYLQRKGIPVTVFEAASRAGGVIQSVRHDGFLAECGPNTILETSPKVRNVVDDLALTARRLDPDAKAEARYVVRYKRPIEMPASPLGFFATKLFSPKAKLAVLREPFVPARRDGTEESIGQFVVRRLDQEFLDHAIDALVAGIYAGDPNKLSLQQAFPKLAKLEQEYGSLIKGQLLGARARKKRGEVAKDRAPKFSFDEGLQVLTDTLADKSGDALQLNTAVTRIVRRGDSWELTLRQGTRDYSRGHDIVLYAGTAYKLAELQIVDGQRALDLKPFAEIRHPPVASVVLGFKREDVTHPCFGFGMLIPKVEGFNILGTIFSSSLFPNRAPAGHLTLTSYIGGERRPELASLPSEKLVELTVKDLEVLLGVRGKPVFTHTAFYPRAIPQYNVGFAKYRQLLNDIESQTPGLFFAGHYRDGVSLSDSILSGCNAADRIAAACDNHSAGPHQSTNPSIHPSTNIPGTPPLHLPMKGVLLLNLGSPDSPSVPDVRRYLREFLMDSRVLDVNWMTRFCVVHFAILPKRPKESAHAYRKIWTDEGSPLVVTSKHVCEKLQKRVKAPIELCMRYQNPSIPYAIRSLAGKGVDDLLLIPLFPHYAMSSFESAVVRVKEVAARIAPKMRVTVQPPCYRDEDYINALVASAKPCLDRGFDHLLFSYHGIPERQLYKTDPTGCHCLKTENCCETPSPARDTCYRSQCFRTTAEFVKKTNIPPAKYSISFQSRLGRTPWLKPYTDYEIPRLVKAGVKRMLVISPAFVSDCLETIEEIGMRGRDSFMKAGGKEFALIPCMNEHPLWLDALQKMIDRFLGL